MAEQYAGALYLVPVIVAALVAFVVTRPEKLDTSETVAEVQPELPAARVERRASPRRQATVTPHPTLLHAALSSHLSAVSRRTNPTQAAAAQASRLARLAAHQSARLVSIRRPTRIPRRPSHRCPRKPE